MKKRLIFLCRNCGKWKKTSEMFSWTFLFTLLAVINVHAKAFSQFDQNVSIKMEDVYLRDVLWAIEKQTDFVFVYNREDLDKVGKINVDVSGNTIEEIVEKSLKGSGLVYVIQDEVIVLKPAETTQQQTENTVQVKGQVLDEDGLSLPGATIRLKGSQTGTVTDIDGMFTLRIPEVTNPVIEISFVGMITEERVFRGEEMLNIVLRQDNKQLEEVTVISTGMFNRDINSFTGSVSTYSGEELRRISPQNVLQAIKTLDPAFRITENNQFGSDPNRMPEVTIRGKASVVNLDAEFGSDPNQPLFILDGFEVPLSTIVDLDMERVDRIYVLKDASSTAMYGAKAANGVVVIDTRRPKPGKLDVSYAGTFSVNIPDLTDYNMMNAREKLMFEEATGYYHRPTHEAEIQHEYLRLYNKRKGWVESGIDTDWLSEPVRTGFVHKHSINATGGGDVMYYSLGANYTGNQGAMKKSGRDIFGMNIDLVYRQEKFNFANNLSLEYVNGYNPPVSFDTYANTNPYYPKKFDGEIPEYLDDFTVNGIRTRVDNPMYNASLNYINEFYTYALRNNLQFNYRPINDLRLTGRFSIVKAIGFTENFVSPLHTAFKETTKVERGSYAKSTTDEFQYLGNVSMDYGKLFNEMHQINILARFDFESKKTLYEGYSAIGFPDDRVPNPAFSNEYAKGKPSYRENLNRMLSYVVNVNYIFNERYALDFNLRRDGSTNFGSNKRYTTTYSIGAAWNLHKEDFIGDWARFLKLRASYGNPGNNRINVDTYLSYVYNTNQTNHFGTGAMVDQFANSNLDWQKTKDFNVGMDLTLRNSRLSLTANWYVKDTDPLLVHIDVAPSIGKSNVAVNLGKSRIIGYDITANYRIIDKRDLIWNVNVMGGHVDGKYSKMGDKLKSLNGKLGESASLRRYYDGGSPDDIWAARSYGIDPSTGDEIFLKKNGELTYVYDRDDDVVVGNTQPTLEGTIGSSLFWKRLTVSAFFRYSFGKDRYNSELHNKIENIEMVRVGDKNQDKRAYYDRWKEVGDRTQFRNIVPPGGSSTETYRYPNTSRYVQRENYFTGESISASYDFRGAPWLNQVYLRNMRVTAMFNDIFRWSTIKAERGIQYPFARLMTLSVSLIFK